jgi:hypothetical protein
MMQVSKHSKWLAKTWDYIEAEGSLKANLSVPIGSIREPRRTTSEIDFLAVCFMLVSYLAYSSTMKMEEIYSSETLVDFQRSTRHCIPENGTLI